MSGKIILFLFSIFTLFPGLVFADVIINEIQLSPTENRFIELYNNGDSVIDLTGWYIQRKTATGSTFGSLISSPNFEGKVIGAYEYFLISKTAFNNSDIVLNFTLTESNTIQIKNSNGVIVDKLGWGDSSDCNNVCPSNPINGESLSRTTNNFWSSGVPTPGAINENTSNSSITETSNVSTEENIAVTSSSAKQKIKTQIIAKNIAFVGIPLEFQANTTGYYGELMSYGKYFWNFGDGDSKETKINEGKFFHTYFYPGDYDVNLEYYLAYNSGNPDAIDKRVIKIIVPDIVISKVGEAGDFFIELTNNTNYEANLSSWRLTSDRMNFSLPQNTILGSKKKIILSPHITGFSIEDKSSLKLMTPQGEVVYSYLTPIIPVPILPKTTSPAVKPLEVLEENKIDEVFEEDLSASVVNSESNNNYLPMFVFVLFLGTTSSAVYFIRSKKKPILSGDDFELIDE
jgi:hypothetical protein